MHPADLPFTTLEDTDRDATVFRCPLCAAEFTHARMACPSCPVQSACSLISCPQCGYGFPRSSRLADWVNRLLGRDRRRPK